MTMTSSEEGRGPRVSIWSPHMDTVPFSSGPPWDLLPPKSAPQADVMCHGATSPLTPKWSYESRSRTQGQMWGRVPICLTAM